MLKELTRSGRLILPVIFLLLLSLTGRSQTNSKISIKGRNITLADVFKSIKKQTGLTVFYSNKLLDDSEKISVDFTGESISAVMSSILKGRQLDWLVKEKYIVLQKATGQVQPQQLKTEQVSIDNAPKLKGTVTDKTGNPLPGVSIRVKDAGTGTASDAQGRYTIAASRGATLLFSSVGYLSQEIQVGSQTTLNVKLQEDNADLTEVVVVGYGTQKKVNLTGAVSMVSGKDLSVRPMGQTSASLQGMAPGVTIRQTSGRPGADGGNIRIRGIGTMSASQSDPTLSIAANPLIMIDGIEGSMNNIDPNLIESVSILKDAASSSIYGSRAANGVILITTKRANADQVSISYNNYIGWQDPTNMPKLVNALDYMLLINEAYTNTGRTPLYTEALIQKYREQNGVSSDLYPNTDWQKETLTGSGLQQSHFLTVQGGTQKVKILGSFGLFDQKGLIENSGFKRYTIRSNADITFSDKLKARIDLQYVNAITTDPAATANEIFQWTNGLPANLIGINESGQWGVGWNGNNPISASKDGGTNRTRAPFGSINATINYKPVEWLEAEAAYSPKYALSSGKNFRKAIQSYLPNGSLSFLTPALTSLNQTQSQSFFNNIRATITARKDLNDHSFKFLLGGSREDYYSEWISAYRDTYILPNYPILNGGSALNQTATGSAEEWALQSLFSRFNYSYKGKYLLELNARYDGSSRFSKGNKYGFFPSASAGWRISEEAFFAGLKNTVNEAKLRVSWGKLGNQLIGTYPSVTALVFESMAMGKQIVNTATLKDMANRNISWESTEEKNIGIDLTLFNNLSVTADYYQRRTRDILLLLDIPLIIGLNRPNQNAGTVDNKGWELGLAYKGKVKDFNYNLSFNLSDVKNTVVDMRGINQTSTLTVHREGYSISSLFGYEALGYFSSDAEVAAHAKQFGTVKAGDIKYKDQNGDGLINESDKIIIGGTIPRYTYAANLAASYKGFDLSVLLQGVGKADGYLNGPGVQPFSVGGALGGTIREENKDRWSPDNPNAKYPRLAFGESNNEQASSFWRRDASYLRVKNIQLGYTLPANLTKKMSINRLRIFANGSNLASFDRFLSGYDVEAPVGSGSIYPQVKLYSFGLEATF
ncbi:TonB-linked SusC/RagA family outer membrane protein [Pedobacter africanus]|uniref:TonB-linked SusC/RagA family outer membrane protein n=1 Tax=Pedobacter africanus TaxID=151894 RepID=A0ACC6KU18_9SPHI|nr:TonB-dependent receptor [Pedobacter africanus]MDR6782596.1 TonB-linked SusC/RagA family outer membrane protein [Pedobacter africanus]